LKDINAERLDFVLGSFDVVVLLRGTIKSIDSRIMEPRSPYIRKIETLLVLEMYDWEEMSGRLNEQHGLIFGALGLLFGKLVP